MATEAAGEGINLQVCNILFNYDIPWNPNRLEQRMGRIHRYGQRKDCLIFNFVATNTIEGRVLQRLLEKLQEIRDALEDDAVFNVVGEVLPAAHVERVLRDYYAGRFGDADLEERLLRDVDESQFRAICQNALEGLASKKLNLEMLIERRAQAQERRVVPETIARFLHEAAEFVPFTLKPVPGLAHTFEPARTPPVLRRYEKDADWKLPRSHRPLSTLLHRPRRRRYEKLEWVTPGHPLFEAIRRHTHAQALDVLSKGATFHSLQHDHPTRIDFYRARVVDGLGSGHSRAALKPCLSRSLLAASIIAFVSLPNASKAQPQSPEAARRCRLQTQRRTLCLMRLRQFGLQTHRTTSQFLMLISRTSSLYG